jgi:HK97 family phage major capsid protein/HK97 family phage prohead protease
MGVSLNSAGASNATARIAAGDIDHDSAWSFSAEDGNALLGPEGDDWTNYSKWFLGFHPGEPVQTKGYYGYPFGKGGKIYRSAVIAIKQRAAAEGDSAIENKASALLSAIDAKKAALGFRQKNAMRRAWATLEIKEVSDTTGKRLFKGIASTPETDRMGDVVEPLGAQFSLPIPLLWQHDSAMPIGAITYAKATKAGIQVEGYVEQLSDPPSLKDDLDRAWALMKSGLVRGLSVGFIPLEMEPLDAKDPWGGQLFKLWDWLELSAVTIAANAKASLQTMNCKTVRDLDQTQRAALGQSPPRTTEPASTSPGASGNQNRPASRGFFFDPSKGSTVKTIGEQIAALEAARAAKSARMGEIMQKSIEESRSTTDEERQEFDDLQAEVKTADGDLVRLRQLEAVNRAAAAPVNAGAAGTANGAGSAAARQPLILHGASVLPKGRKFARLAACMAAAKGNTAVAAEIAKAQPGWKDSSPDVENVLRDWHIITRTAAGPGTTTDSNFASALVQYNNMASEFVDLLRPATIIGKLAALRRVPFNIRFPTLTSGVSVGWVGQGNAAPATKQVYTSTTLGFAKIAAIIAITKELAQFSSPAAEDLIQNDLLLYTATFMDQQFIDPGVAAVSVSPASITNGITPIQASAAPTTLASIEVDTTAAVNALSNANVPLDGLVWVMTPQTAFSISQLRTSNGPYAFPDININGGTWLGIPVIVSNSVPHGVSAGSIVVLFRQGEIFMADDGGVEIDASTEASVQLDTAPSNSAASLLSLWQSGLLGIRVERVVNWQRRRDVAVTYIDNFHI